MRRFRIIYVGDQPLVMVKLTGQAQVVTVGEIMEPQNNIIAEGIIFDDGMVAMRVAPGWSTGHIEGYYNLTQTLNRFTVYGSFREENVTVEFLDDEPDPTQNAIVRELLKMAKAMCVEPMGLDDLVHEVAAESAAAINNEGLEGQIRYLLDEAGLRHTRRWIEEAAK
jgi:hypothetical protein